MTEEENGLGAAEPAANLDTIIDSAYDTHTPKEDAPAAEAAVEASPEPRADHPTDATRYADGTFKPTKTDTAKASEQEPAKAATTEPAPVAEPAPVQPVAPPERWTPEEKAKFAAWPRDVQEAVVERHKALEADYTRKTQEAADLRRSAEPILNAVKPFEAYLNQLAPRIGQTPDKMIGQLLGVEYQLRTGDAYEKAAALHQIAQSYGIDLAALSRGELPQGADPAYSQLRQSFGSIEQEVRQLREEREQERQQQIVAQIQAFSTSTDEAGRPKYPFFEEVRGRMGKLMSEDPSLDLPTAYAKASEPLNQRIAEELRLRTENSEKQRLESVEKAKKAAPIKSSGSQPNGSTKAKDLDSILSAAIDSRMSA
jgi:hypothetical protein